MNLIANVSENVSGKVRETTNRSASETVIEALEAIGLIPVVAIPKLQQALPLAEALLAGGLPCAEITFRTAAAAEAIAQIKAHFPALVLGAGTVLSVDQVEAALDNGASYIVAPGTTPAVVEHCVKKGVPIFPGVCTPTEIELALNCGAEVLKFFPAEAAGGTKFLQAVGAPYRHVRFIPTGGIDLKNIGNYLAIPQVVACGGSWMVKPDLLNAGDYATVQRLSSEAVALVKQLRS